MPRVYLALIAALLVAVGALTYLVQSRAMVGLDLAVAAAIRSPQDCRLVDITNWTSILFSAEATVMLCAVLTIGLLRAGYGRRAFAPWPACSSSS